MQKTSTQLTSLTRVADLATVRSACVTRCHQDLLNLRRLSQLPGQRMLPSTAANHQHPLRHDT